jgi:protein-tyrosine-phosphatase
MAEGFARHYGEGIVESKSAGTRPGKEVAPLAIEAMEEKGIDISGLQPKILTIEMIKEADILISMGCGVQESCPLPLRNDIIDWGLDDPYGQSIKKYREIRDEIERKVKELIEELVE